MFNAPISTANLLSAETTKFYVLRHKKTGAYFTGAHSEPSTLHAMYAGTITECDIFGSKETAEAMRSNALKKLADDTMTANEVCMYDFIAESDIVTVEKTVTYREPTGVATRGV